MKDYLKIATYAIITIPTIAIIACTTKIFIDVFVQKKYTVDELIENLRKK